MKLYVLFTGLLSNNYLSGGDQLFLDLAERLPAEIELTVITPEFAKKHWQNIKRQGTKFKYLPKNIFDSYYHPVLVFFSYIVRSWQAYFILKKEKK